MSQKLKLDKDFRPCIVDDGDEVFRNGIFQFNITKMIDFIRQNKSQILMETVDVKSLRTGFSSSLSEETIAAAQLSTPIILAEISPARYNVIDGNHRLERAFREELTEVSAYKLTMSLHFRFLTSAEAYIAYVRYWNEKVRSLKN